MSATTIRDLAIKAAVIRRFTWDDGEAEVLLYRLAELGGIEAFDGARMRCRPVAVATRCP